MLDKSDGHAPVFRKERSPYRSKVHFGCFRSKRSELLANLGPDPDQPGSDEDAALVMWPLVLDAVRPRISSTFRRSVSIKPIEPQVGGREGQAEIDIGLQELI